jgi:hypothetical protein
MLCPEKVRRLWLDHTITMQEITFELKCSDTYARKVAKRMGLPRRPPGGCRRGFVEISPAEIAERAAIVRSWWSEEERERRMCYQDGWEPPVVKLGIAN